MSYKASGSKSGFQCGGIERYERVVDVGLANPVSIEGVHCHEPAAGSQHSVQFGKQLILRPFRRACGAASRSKSRPRIDRLAVATRWRRRR
jgi:hypothetical protein